MKAFIIGNGPSRQVLNLSVLKQHGIIWGCNALYRDFAPHYLVVIDRKMQEEVLKSKYHENNLVIFKKVGNGSHLPEHPNIYTFNHTICSPNNSGAAAIHFALKRGHRDLYMIGFDHENGSKGQQNVYSETNCYNRHGTRPPKLPKNVTDKIAFWADKNIGKIRFTRVIDPDTCTIPPSYGNIRHINYGEFLNELH